MCVRDNLHVWLLHPFSLAKSLTGIHLSLLLTGAHVAKASRFWCCCQWHAVSSVWTHWHNRHKHKGENTVVRIMMSHCPWATLGSPIVGVEDVWRLNYCLHGNEEALQCCCAIPINGDMQLVVDLLFVICMLQDALDRVTILWSTWSSAWVPPA